MISAQFVLNLQKKNLEQIPYESNVYRLSGMIDDRRTFSNGYLFLVHLNAWNLYIHLNIPICSKRFIINTCPTLFHSNLLFAYKFWLFRFPQDFEWIFMIATLSIKCRFFWFATFFYKSFSFFFWFWWLNWQKEMRNWFS